MSSSSRKKKAAADAASPAQGLRAAHAEDLPTSYKLHTSHSVPSNPAAPGGASAAPLAARVRENVHFKLKHSDMFSTSFDLAHTDPALANALRRIMLAEVPTMAIESVTIHENTSVIPDEVLASRLGLIPIWVDFEDLASYPVMPGGGQASLCEVTGDTHIRFRLEVHCRTDTPLPRDAPLPPPTNVLSGELKFVPTDNRTFAAGKVPKPALDDIVIAKLQRGQSIVLDALCVKGIGKDHAKYSPVATATYRLLPKITLSDRMSAAQAEKLVQVCPMNVFEIEDAAAVVKRPRECTLCRECIREDGWEELVQLEREGSHFLFEVESVGSLHPEDIVTEAIGVLKGKADALFAELSDDSNGGKDDEMQAD